MLTDDATSGECSRSDPGAASLARMAHAGAVAHAFFVPISLAGTQLSLLVALGALLLAWARGLPGYRRSPLDLPLVLAAGAMVAATGIAALRGFPLPDPSSVTRWRPLLAPLVILSALSLPVPGDGADAPRDRAVGAVLAWCAGAVVAGLVGIGQGALGVDLLHVLGVRSARLQAVPRWPGHFTATGFFSGYMKLAHSLGPPLLLAAALALLAPLRRGRRVAVATGAAVAAVAVGFTSSRAAWAGLAVGVAVLLALAGGRALRAGLPVAVAALAGIALAIPGLRARLLHAFAPGVNGDRDMIWTICRAVLADHPLGVGPGNFTAEADRYFEAMAPEALIRTGCHDVPLQLLVEGGPLLLSAWLAAALLLVRAFARARRGGDALGRAGAAGALAALASFAVTGLFFDLHRVSHATWPMALVLGLAGALALPRRAAGTPPPGPAGRGARMVRPRGAGRPGGAARPVV